MADDRTYNGWTNYETWNVALWLGNDQGSSEYWDGEAARCLERAIDGEGNPYADNVRERAAMLLADQLESEIGDSKDDMLEASKLSASMFADLLGAALSEVDWREIADHYVNDLQQFGQYVYWVSKA